MGQYYHNINLDTFEYMSAHDYDNGLKLMEHSYLGNEYVGAVMRLLMKGGSWYKTRVVWCGDYSEKVIEEYNLYDFCREDMPVFKNINPTELPKNESKLFIVNHTKKEYVDLSEIKSDGDDWKINPLPLLTALGNGRGGGDYCGTDMCYIGYWACDVLSVEEDITEFKDFEKISPEFVEGEEDSGNPENEERAYEKIKKWVQENKEQLNKKIVIQKLK